jgi:ketosteroid isomerase-like protein
MAFEEIEVESFAYADVSVRTYGDVAVMQSRWHQRARLRGDDWSGEGLLTDVWVRRDGRWQVVARHSSLVSNPR